MSMEEEQIMQTIYNILRQGCKISPEQIISLQDELFLNLPFPFFLRTTESDVIIRHKVKLIFQKFQNLKVCRPDNML